MEVILAKSAGFCFGVHRAVDAVYEQVEKKDEIYTYGPIIHNEQVVADLTKKGVKVINSCDELKQIEKGTVVIRSHGVEKVIYDLIEAKGLTLVDATCPFVKKIHKIVEEESLANNHIVVIGNRNHPEVEGIVGWANGDVYVVENEEMLYLIGFDGTKKLNSIDEWKNQ